MKILFTGGGSGGHFYPIIAIAEAIYELTKDKKILTPKLYFMSPSKYNPRALFDNNIEFVAVPAGKVRRYFSLLNFTDLFKTAYGIFIALVKLYRIYPDIVFGKGGYASFPTLVAARILRIPVMIHESDSKPGRVNVWAAKFAVKIAVSYPEAMKYFSERGYGDKVAFTGLPIRKGILEPLSHGANEFFALEDGVPTILVLGGSQGAQKINDMIIDSISELVKRYQIIHQTGRNNIDMIRETMGVVLKDNDRANRYHPFDYMNDLSLRMSAGVASVVVSRAGSSIFEIAQWGIPSIILPLPENVSHDQTENAFSYARAGACTVIEDRNFSSHILISAIDNIVNNKHVAETMRSSAKDFSHTDAASKIGLALLDITLEHE